MHYESPPQGTSLRGTSFILIVGKTPNKGPGCVVAPNDARIECEDMKGKPPEAPTNTFIHLGGNLDWDACGSKYGKTPHHTSPTTSPSLRYDSSPDDSSEYEESPNKAKSANGGCRGPTCRRSVPLRGEGKGKGKQAILDGLF